ncbi:hypothetical protein NM449_17755 (plasmid) [Vibrio metschnikovii]|uniref:hypothetical protein n=1 Tax=Vibrio metschnikovii TaxID=28172 RepID=UPI00315CC6E1
MDAEIDSIESANHPAAELQLQDVSYRLAMAEQELDAQMRAGQSMSRRTTGTQTRSN